MPHLSVLLGFTVRLCRHHRATEWTVPAWLGSPSLVRGAPAVVTAFHAGANCTGTTGTGRRRIHRCGTHAAALPCSRLIPSARLGSPQPERGARITTNLIPTTAGRTSTSGTLMSPLCGAHAPQSPRWTPLAARLPSPGVDDRAPTGTEKAPAGAANTSTGGTRARSEITATKEERPED